MDALPAYFNGILAVLLLTSFVKIATTLSIVRFGLGLNGMGFGLAVVALALSLSLMVMAPGDGAEDRAVKFLSGEVLSDPQKLDKQFRPFLEKHVDPEVAGGFQGMALRLSGRENPQEGADDVQLSFSVLVSAFLVSELKVAFQLGFIILIPFLVVDLLVANVLLALGVVQFSHGVLAVPLKILLFFGLDGWFLISQRLIGTYI